MSSQRVITIDMMLASSQAYNYSGATRDSRRVVRRVHVNGVFEIRNATSLHTITVLLILYEHVFIA